MKHKVYAINFIFMLLSVFIYDTEKTVYIIFFPPLKIFFLILLKQMAQGNKDTSNRYNKFISLSVTLSFFYIISPTLPKSNIHVFITSKLIVTIVFWDYIIVLFLFSVFTREYLIHSSFCYFLSSG